MKFIFILIICFNLQCILGVEPSQARVQMLYNSLDPKSIPEHLAFYQLYKNTPLGKQALNVSWQLLSGKNKPVNNQIDHLTLNPSIIDKLVNLVNKQSDQEITVLNDDELKIINFLSRDLPHKKLKGYLATSEEEVLKLPPDEIDLARGLFLSQLGNSESAMLQLQSYEAMIDLMALQILAKLPINATPEEKIALMNELIFEEMGFRFPPHSLYAKDVDIYTFLPSVLDSRRGVCLGVSILYICLSQRLQLPLEMVTPPGHIYIRYKNGDQIINIETTARGIHLDCEEYLSVDTRSLELRTIKEVIGLAHFNLAATFWHRQEHQKTIDAYLKALPYLQEDKQLKALLGFAYLLSGQKDKGEDLLKQVKDHLPDYAVSKDLMAEEYLNGLVGSEGIGAIFKPVDENRASIIEKKNELDEIVKKYPKFTSGIFSLAVSWLQLHRQKEALEVLEYYHSIDSLNPTVEYYLTVLYAERYDYKKAWEHFLQTEKLVEARDHHPKTLKELRRHLSSLSPY
jgi:regulator of sirC expression with transglutaminase-like and TPR domain